MQRTIQPADLAFFSSLAAAGNLSAAGRELGVSTAAVSKHLALMESRCGAVLVNRTTRRMSLTSEGQLYLAHARRILAQIGEMEQQLGAARGAPSGLLRVRATPGFGRQHVAPLISNFIRAYPHVQVQLELSAQAPGLADDSFEVAVAFGAPPDARVQARRVARNRRLLAAAPSYLALRGTPRAPADLAHHDCIVLRQGDEPTSAWRLAPDGQAKGAGEAVHIDVRLATNDGETAVQWALDGHGIVLRAQWDLERHLRSGRLVRVLPGHSMPDADIHLIWPEQHRDTARVRLFVDHASAALGALGAIGSSGSGAAQGERVQASSASSTPRAASRARQRHTG